MISIQQNLNSGNPLTQSSSDTRTLSLKFIRETNKPQHIKIEDLLNYLCSEIPCFDIINNYPGLFTTEYDTAYLISHHDIKKYKNCKEQLGIGGNGQVFLCTDLGTLELHAVKLVSDIPFDNVNQILNECINQFNLMQLNNEMILNIVNHIQIRVVNSKVQFLIPLELAEFSLYDYIQTNEINEEIYQQLINILIDFLILLHKNKYAHRDIKPQNILYVKDIGWKLADFGESIQYEECQGMYKIKGTLSFTPKDVRINSKQNKEILQDLFRNDVYATVCTLVMIKNPQFKSKDLEKFMQENQLDAICQRLINITQVEELHQFNQKKLLRFQYSGKPLQRREELIFYDLKLSIQRFKNLDKKLDDRIMQIIDKVLYKLKGHNKLVGYNKYVLLIIQNFPFSTDKFKNIIRLDYKDILKNPKNYFFNARNHQMYLFGRGLHKKLFDYYNIPSDSFNNMVIKLFQLILCNLFDEAKLQLNLIASKIYSESSQVNSDFLGFYNYLYFILHGEYPIIKVMSTKEIQKQQLVKRA